MPDVRKCITCNGTGKVRVPGTNKFEPCYPCNGTGKVTIETI